MNKKVATIIFAVAVCAVEGMMMFTPPYSPLSDLIAAGVFAACGFAVGWTLK
ncbi:hypothetical protein LV478_13195 [Komagataeibacter oboediens]|uniref:hypothetical protein n=1 Tax=Komagataeibacter oboediens TaxID=65958 RepID=UPI0023DBBF9A|nr:hypothetical protein [Komagataeibacter oboediens]WEQ51470.1 hypothetical protein LV478_13195 [Komagataeibacter oboediens]